MSMPATPQGSLLIVGSKGRMGAFLLRRLHALRTPTNFSGIYGVDRPLTQDVVAPLCATASVVLLCVPAASIKKTILTLRPYLPAQCVLADITSVKMQPMEYMQELWSGPVVGTHPLFGPRPLKGGDLPVAIVGGEHAKEEHITLVESLFTAISCRVFRCSASQHDKAMAAIQNLNFITSLAYFAALADNEDLVPFLTPSFRRRQDAAQKMLTEDAPLFQGLFEANPHSHELIRQYRAFLNVAAGGDIELLASRAGWWWS